MSNFKLPRLNDEDILSPSSDEKMDTGSESFRSQDTPNSVLSSEFDDNPEQNVLRLQNPENEVLKSHILLRLADQDTNNGVKSKTEWNDSLISKMSNLNIDSPKMENRPKVLGISPPKFSSTLTSTTSHPLMGLASPEENYPDLVPKNDKDLSLSSIEDERHSDTNGFYSPQRNTSKNNLYFTENFVTAESQIIESRLDTPQSSLKITERRKIVPRFTELKRETPQRNLDLASDMNKEESAIREFIERNKLTSQSTPKSSFNIDVPEKEVFHSGVAEWCESPSHLRRLPNFDLPIEMSTSIGLRNELNSPDVVSSSTQEDRSAYQALLDPYTGSVALRQTTPKSPNDARRRIVLPPEEDRCSLDSMSACSMESEDEPPPILPDEVQPPSDDEETKRSKSSNTISECSEPIPEYSAAEELSNERSWISVPRGQGHVVCDMKVIEPYKRALSHGGYDARGSAVIVFSACHLPDTARPDYRYVMDNLFLYVIWTLERLVTDEYVLVYLHGSAGSRRLPTIHWLSECYKLIDKRLRKSLKQLYIVHPTFWLRSFVALTKLFVSSKFFRKLNYVRSLEELSRVVPVEPNAIPELVKQYDTRR